MGFFGFKNSLYYSINGNFFLTELTYYYTELVWTLSRKHESDYYVGGEPDKDGHATIMLINNKRL